MSKRMKTEEAEFVIYRKKQKNEILIYMILFTITAVSFPIAIVLITLGIL